MESGKAVGFLATLGGAGVAAYADSKYADKSVAGLTPGTLLGVAAAALGMSGFGGAQKAHLLSIGEGALAGEMYRVVTNKLAAQPAATQGVMGRLSPSMRIQYGTVGARGPVTHAEALQHLNALRAIAR